MSEIQRVEKKLKDAKAGERFQEKTRDGVTV